MSLRISGIKKTGGFFLSMHEHVSGTCPAIVTGKKECLP
jgi:hypothetical protein